ncbi:outer membrane protein [Rhodomicrobium sp.]|uniref:outer membrane protein n=1 Tax=Rhodomicrobium sp. TaxID=2720632 RepID=UPI0039E27468
MRVIFASTLAILMSTAAQSADLSYKDEIRPAQEAPLGWTGLYVGVHGGYAAGRNEWRDFSDPLYPWYVVPGIDTKYDIDGALAGGQIGYNWQINRTVIGVEADAAWADIDGQGKGGAFGGSCLQSSDPCTTKIDALGTIAGRVGVTFDHALLYAKGGVAWAHAKYTAGYTVPLDPGYNYSGKEEETRWGWTVGAGLEYAFTSNLSAKVEYNYVDLGDDRVKIFYPTESTFAASGKSDETLHVVKIGLNYRLGR